MFCNSNVSAHNVLRSFRSHKHIRDQERMGSPSELENASYQQAIQVPIQHVRPVQKILHPRRPSEASSVGTMRSDISSSRPSTSDTVMTERSEGSLNINPLRLNPTTEDDCVSPTILMSPPRHHYQTVFNASRSRMGTSKSVDHGLDFSVQNENYREPLRTGSLEVYGGFDFGFDTSNKTPGAAWTPSRRTPGGRTPGGRTPGRMSHPGAGSDYFGIIQPKSHWSDSESDDEEEEEEDEDDDMDETPGGPGPETSATEFNMSPVRPRPQPQDSQDSPVKKFIQRGDWKRRGIVFTATAPTTTTEDKCFDLAS